MDTKKIKEEQIEGGCNFATYLSESLLRIVLLPASTCVAHLLSYNHFPNISKEFYLLNKRINFF